MQRLNKNKLSLLRSAIMESKPPAIRNLLCAVNCNDTILPRNYKWIIANGWYPSRQIFKDIRVYGGTDISASILEVSVDATWGFRFHGMKYNIYYAQTAEDIANIRALSRDNPSIIVASDSECIMNAMPRPGEFIITESQLYAILDDPALKWRSFAMWPQLWHIWLVLTAIGLYKLKVDNDKKTEEIKFPITFHGVITKIHESLRDNRATMLSLGLADCNSHADIIKVDKDDELCYIISLNPNGSLKYKLIYIDDSDKLRRLPELICKNSDEPLNIIIYNDNNLEKGDVLEFINSLQAYTIIAASKVIKNATMNIFTIN